MGAGERGQASVQLVAVLPALLLAALVAAQLAVVGHALWSAGTAARAGARAAHVGADPERVARRALPGALREGARVEAGADIVRVRIAAPSLVPGLPSIELGTGAGMDPGAGDG